MKGFGGLSHFSKESARIQQIIKEAFEHIEPEDLS